MRPALPLIYASMLAGISSLRLVWRRIYYVAAIVLSIIFSVSWLGIPKQLLFGTELFSINIAKTTFQDPLGVKTCFKTLNQEHLAEEAAIMVSSYPMFLADHDIIIRDGIIPEYLFKYHLRKCFLSYAYLYKNKPLNELLEGIKEKNLNALHSSFPNSTLITTDASLVINSGNCIVKETYPKLSLYTMTEISAKKYYFLKSYTGHELQRIRCIIAYPGRNAANGASAQQ